MLIFKDMNSRLDGCDRTLAEGRINYLFISTHSQDIHENVLKDLNRHGYCIEVSSDFDHDTTSFDGFIFASSPCTKKIFRYFKPLGRTKIVESRARDLLVSISEIQLDTRENSAGEPARGGSKVDD